MRPARDAGLEARVPGDTRDRQMANLPQILNGLSEIASDYDALVCDVWGVLHNGKSAYAGAVEALRRFRAGCGPVVLLSNAARLVSGLEEQFRKFGVPLDCYDGIVTSGAATRAALAERAKRDRLPIFYIGPDYNRALFEELPIDCVEPDHASVVLCAGLFRDDHETPDDYRAMLVGLKRRGLVMLCGNPDIVAPRGDSLVYCAGALARLYEQMGGETVYYGKPHRPIYDITLAMLRKLAGRAIHRPLAIGDGLETDIAGANRAGIEALFIADGIHGEKIPRLLPEPMQHFLDEHQVMARAVLRTLVW